MLFHLLLEPPKSKLPVPTGNTLELIVEVKVTLSVLAFPRITSPLNVETPETLN